jgi:hypothetical protein
VCTCVCVCVCAQWLLLCRTCVCVRVCMYTLDGFSCVVRVLYMCVCVCVRLCVCANCRAGQNTGCADKLAQSLPAETTVRAL